MKLHVALALFLSTGVAWALPAQATDYRIVTMNEKLMSLMDFSTLKKTSPSLQVEATNVIYHRHPVVFEEGEPDTVDYVIGRAQYDCAYPGRYRLLSTKGYSLNHLGPVYDMADEPWEVANANTVGKEHWNSACKGLEERYRFANDRADGYDGSDHRRNLMEYRQFIEHDQLQSTAPTAR